MRQPLVAVVLAGLLTAGSPGLASAPAPQNGPSSKPGSATASHAARGVVAAVTSTSLVVLVGGRQHRSVTFVLDASTLRAGTPTVGSMVSVRYREDGDAFVATAVTADATPRPGVTRTTDTVMLRGRPQTVYLYGSRGGVPVVVSSGDGGWMHLGPQVAEFLAARGFFVVGFDAKAYLESFTSGSTTLGREEVPDDYRVLAEYAMKGSQTRPLLVGVSEGAGLSVLAATAPRTRDVVAGVIGLGLPEVNELGWRWRDALIYLTHGVPKEPTFSTSEFVDRVAPLPLAAIHSTKDEFVPVDEVRAVMARAREPKRLWLVAANDHRFTGNQATFERALVEAIDWVGQNRQP